MRGSVNTYSNRISATDRMFRMKGMQLGLKHNFTKSGEELTAEINYFGGKNDGSGLYTTNYYGNTNNIYGTQIQKNLSDGNNKFLTIQTDYVRPFGNKGSLEIGARAQINNLKNCIVVYADGEPIGCGAMKVFDNETMEIKRMYVKENYRGKGVAKFILASLEQWAKEMGNKACVLETSKPCLMLLVFIKVLVI
jgi:predicted GNAT family acetyltransferase